MRLKEKIMIKITNNAKREVLELMKDSGYTNPALKLDFAGFG